MLQQRSVEVGDPVSSEIQQLVDDMFDTMRHYEGAGLAAPQIGVLKRVVIFGFEHNSRYPAAPAIPETVLINPVIEILGTEEEQDWEGCLSLPGMRGMVSRPLHIRYTAHNHYGEQIDHEAKGFHARVVLHECDHLDGILYIQKLTDIREFGFIPELQYSERYTPPLCDSSEK